MPKTLLECRNVGKSYEGETVFVRVNLAVRAGESVSLVGGSGEGKSTLLSILGLLLEPSCGSVEVGGQATDTLGDRDLSALRARAFGFVFQHNQLVGSLTATGNAVVPACFPGASRGAPGFFDQSYGRAEELLRGLGMEGRLNHFPHQLSVGQKRRVALARALLLEPLLIIADEPTNDLDPAASDAVMRALLGYPDEGHAVLYSTHDMEKAAVADRCLLLRDGELREIEPAQAKEVFS